MIRTALNAATEFLLHVASILAIVGLLPLPIDARLGIALLHSIVVMYVEGRCPTYAWRYLLLSSSALAIAYAVAMYFQGPAQLLAKSFCIAVIQPTTSFAPSASAPNWSFNSDATSGHAFGIFMACRGALRTSCSGAG